MPTTILDLFKGSPFDKAVKADKDTVIEQEFSGIRTRSAVELNNPLLYGNQAIRIATRSTSDVEKMKQATGGSAATGGLIGQALGKITEGKFGKFVFGGKVTSLNQARDGINTRLGIPGNAIPTYVYNTGGLQAGIEPDTMITIGKIKNDANGTLLGQFLKKTGGGTPKTIGNQLIGGGISLGKSKLRNALFGNPASMGSNTASSTDSFSGIDSGGKRPANGGWEYSSNLPYSKQISTAKFATKAINGYTDGAASNILKKTAQLQDDAKKKLGESLLNAQNDLLKNARKGTATQEVVDSAKKDREKNTPAWNNRYSDITKTYRIGKSQETKLKTPTQEKIDSIIKDTFEKDKEKESYNYTPKENYYYDDSTYTSQLGAAELDDKNDGDGKFTRIDLSLVSPVYGVNRKDTNGVYGNTGYAFFDVKNNTGRYSPYNPTNGNHYTSKNKSGLETTYGIKNGSDVINESNIQKGVDSKLEKSDLIPFWIQSIRNGETAHFRSYVTSITETTTPAWNTNKFFGNPYNFYTYSGVERSVALNLNVVCLNPKELANNWDKLSFLTKQTYPTFSITNGRKYANAPIVAFRLGDMYNNKISFIDSLTYTVNDNSPWETASDGILLPKFIDVAITFKFIEQAGSEAVVYNIELSQNAVKIINENRGSGGSFTTDSISTTSTTDQPQKTKKPTTPKIDKRGVETSPTKEGGINKPQTNITTGNVEQTPQDKQTGVTTTDKTPSQYAVAVPQKQQELQQQGISEKAARFIAVQPTDMDSVEKINEHTTYFETVTAIGRRSMVYEEQLGAPILYEGWVANYNNGVDELLKL